ncbi:MAG: HAD-IA family hydrolase [Gemmataceae bacterium]
MRNRFVREREQGFELMSIQVARSGLSHERSECSGRIPPGVRAVLFDAVGTIMFPNPPVEVVYASYGQRHGSRRTEAEVKERFARIFAAEEERDRETGHSSSESREWQRWSSIVRFVLDDLELPERCFQEIHTHFGRPESWRAAKDIARVLGEIQSRGLILGVASNFDHRLDQVVAGMPELASLDKVYISSVLGWKKPAPEFFDSICRDLNLAPREILFIGDDPRNDFEGATRFGMSALLLDPAGRQDLPADQRLVSLADLLD